MTHDQLADHLAQLHEELSRTEQLDSETLDQLRQLTADVGRLQGKDEGITPEEAEPVSSALRNLMLRFESDYPRLSLAIGRVADALASIGI